jgi:hypothetical protein
MKPVRKKYVEFLYQGAIWDEGLTQKIKTRHISKIKVPKGAFGFQFFDIVSGVVEVNGKKRKYTSRRINFSPMYYYGGEVYTIAEIKHKFSKQKNLVNNIKNKECKKAIRCRTGNWKPFNDTDIHIKIA